MHGNKLRGTYTQKHRTCSTLLHYISQPLHLSLFHLTPTKQNHFYKKQQQQQHFLELCVDNELQKLKENERVMMGKTL